MNTRRGFTLIELLVVIAIIGLLSSIVLASLAQAKSRAQGASATETAKMVRDTVEEYVNDNGSFPLQNTLYSQGLHTGIVCGMTAMAPTGPNGDNIDLFMTTFDPGCSDTFSHEVIDDINSYIDTTKLIPGKTGNFVYYYGIYNRIADLRWPPSSQVNPTCGAEPLNPYFVMVYAPNITSTASLQQLYIAGGPFSNFYCINHP